MNDNCLLSMGEFDQNLIAKKYNEIDQIWKESDPWYWKTYEAIQQFISSSLNKIDISQLKILNAGSVGNGYNLPESNMVQLDIAFRRLLGHKNSIIGSVEDIPLHNSSFELLVCVGSVINYCDPFLALQEFSRIIRPHGYIILEFENRRTLELLGKTEFNEDVVLIDTFYNGSKEKIWYFSDRLIQQLLEKNHFEILKKTVLSYNFAIDLSMDKKRKIFLLFHRIRQIT